MLPVYHSISLYVVGRCSWLHPFWSSHVQFISPEVPSIWSSISPRATFIVSAMVEPMPCLATQDRIPEIQWWVHKLDFKGFRWFLDGFRCYLTKWVWFCVLICLWLTYVTISDWFHGFTCKPNIQKIIAARGDGCTTPIRSTLFVLALAGDYDITATWCEVCCDP